MAKLTLLDVAKRSGNDIQIGIVESLTQNNALLEYLPFRSIQGTSFKYSRRVSLPTVSFMGLNQGVADSKSIIEQIMAETKIIGGRSKISKLVAELHQGGVPVARSEEASGFISAMGNLYNSKVYYGDSTTNGSEFDGIKKTHGAIGSSVISAAGSTSNVQTSIYAFATADATSIQGRRAGVQGIVSNNTEIQALDMGLQYDVDSGGTNKLLHYITEFVWQPGFIIYDNLSVGRLANINVSTDSKPPTLALLNELVTSMYPYTPSFFTCSKAVFNYLQNIKGISSPVFADPAAGQNLFSRIKMFDGIPIYIDENITATEAVVS